MPNAVGDLWEPIEDPDMSRRTPTEWSNIYGIKLKDNISGLWNEYEWAYNFDKLKYLPNKKDKDNLPDWDSITEYEMRAQFLKRDLFKGADLGEKEMLKQKYIETDWVRHFALRI